MNAPRIAPDGPWTLGVKVGLPFVVLLTLALLAVCFYCGRLVVRNDNKGKRWEYQSGWQRWPDRRRGITVGVVALVALLLFTGGMFAAYFPLDAAYHQYRQVDGTVRTITNRIVAAGDHGSETEYAVTFAGSSQQFFVADTRAAKVKPGDRLTLACVRGFNYGGADEFDCNWGKP